MKIRICSTILLATLLLAGLHTQAQKPSAGPVPAWVTVNKIDYTSTTLDHEAEDGYVDMDFEKQVNLNDQSTFISHSFKIISEAGVQNRSQISVDFDPSYQSLTFNNISILREGKVLNRLDLSKIKTIHQEEGLRDFIYNGTLQAILFVDDVRKGDVLEYSFTLKGFNPIFNNRYSDAFTTAYPSPLYNLYYKLIAPVGKTINLKNTGESVTPTVNIVGANTVYEWKKQLLKPIRTDDHLPSWYNPYPVIMLSEYNNWQEVNKWALSLFPKNIALSKDLAQKIQDIKNNYTSDEARTGAALRFVQDDIRYMGIEMGVHSHKPVNPNKIVEQRFGDCKEKSYLLCTMLQAMGIEASPVLISTDDKKQLAEELPSPRDFDHMTVRATVNGKQHWFDATIAYQRGSLDNIHYPDYQYGLVITDTTTALTPIKPNALGVENIKELFTVKDMSGNAQLVVTTSYTGNFADIERTSFSNNSNYDMQQQMKKFYAYYFEKIKADSLTFIDNDSTGVFTTTEYYTIKDFWSRDKDGKKVTFSAYVISSLIKKPDEQIRTMPYAIEYSGKYHEEVIVDLPEAWNVDTSSFNINSPAFAYSGKYNYWQNRVTMEYDYEPFKDNVMPNEIDDYLANVKTAGNVENFKISYGKDDDKGDLAIQTPGTARNIYMTVGFLLLAGGVVWWTQRATR